MTNSDTVPLFSLSHLLVDLHVSVQRGGVPTAVHVLVHLLGDLLRVAEVRRRHRHLHHDHDVVNLDGRQRAVVEHVTHLVGDGGGNGVVDLPFVQRDDHRAVAEFGLSDHRLGELHLGRDVGHGDGVVVVVGDVQSVRNVEIDDPLAGVVGDVRRLHSYIGNVNGARE